jgi:hypothetical protein
VKFNGETGGEAALVLRLTTGLLHALASLSPGKVAYPYLKIRAGWAPEHVWALWEREKSFASVGVDARSFGFPACSLVVVLTTLTQCQGYSNLIAKWKFSRCFSRWSKAEWHLFHRGCQRVASCVWLLIHNVFILQNTKFVSHRVPIAHGHRKPQFPRTINISRQWDDKNCAMWQFPWQTTPYGSTAQDGTSVCITTLRRPRHHSFRRIRCFHINICTLCPFKIRFIIISPSTPRSSKHSVLVVGCMSPAVCSSTLYSAASLKYRLSNSGFSQ